MAIKATVKTIFGEDKELYIRLNSVEASNHGEESSALFRGFASRDAFDSGAKCMYEKLIQFTPDVSLNLWSQAYSALAQQKNLDATEV